VANPVRLSATPVEYGLPLPQVGEHTEAVLAELLGIEGVAIDTLRRAGVI